jgi:SAM-dependent methyltransferase
VSALAWDHNAFYHRLLLRHLPPSGGRVLDAGCGAGAFAAALAGRVAHVDAVDRSPQMIDAARRVAPPNMACVLADVMRDPLPAAGYDAVVSLSALHHMPLEGALRRLAAALRPGGVLVAAALPRTDLPRELPAELAAAAGQRLFGAAFAALRAAGTGAWYAKNEHEAMPIAGGQLTTRQVRQLAATVLPGAAVRRLVFWRYLLVWHKPAARH